MDEFAEEAYKELFPEKEIPKIEVKYSSRMSPYNSFVRYNQIKISFNMSMEWKEIDDTIKKGLVQSLLMRVYKSRKEKTMYTDLYDSFMRNLHRSVSKDRNDPILEESFIRVNTKFFSSQMERPNLVWGGYTKHVLGNYNYHTDTIRISRYFIDAPHEMLDFIMYHELLHKKIKFKTKRGRSHHHTSHFREKEKEYPGAEEIDKKLHKYIVAKSRELRIKQREEERIQIKSRKRTLLDWFRG